MKNTQPYNHLLQNFDIWLFGWKVHAVHYYILPDLPPEKFIVTEIHFCIC